MTELVTPSRAKRPEFRNINAFTDLPSYRLPAAGWVSILHRVSGALMFVLMPFIIWMFDVSVSSEISFAKFTNAFNQGIGIAPGWFIKLVALALIWAYLHHFIAGLRHLWMDVSHAAVSKSFGNSSARVTLVLSIALALILGAKLFGLY
ncbi:MAG: succinate dehydrogenase, cytochrome b556 subunit [Gammaproteobacteria bacterium]|jgi:succinate dehydrogenase / fumarate reductase cytochrome b subunit|nr:succinate dehydrogenase, cytochrome b556 subunit [Gammaproteobacteria bacterium]MBU0788541.1 succinate dehydrogenase, cytochrome b556 subunit [Gammaproteobacteria bacterium]MBU0815635.1 succinate dehydrogenase, cytochrome b556 subunit [Gammaproteobacteria bacterium]MBU1788157.1 succinate dehydrogenase, cytochrome b556 subunit [Gammaproteobacteria bacterium]